MKALQAALERAVSLGGSASFTDREVATLEFANEAARRCLEADLQRIASGLEEAEVVRVHRRRYRRHQAGRVVYHSLCGPLAVERSTYRDVAARNGPTIVPLDLAAGLIEGATPAFAFSIAQGFAKMPTRHYEEELHAAYRRPPSRSTLERLAKALGGRAKREVAMIEPLVRRHEHVPASAHCISIGLDRTTVPIAEERPPGEAPTTRRKRRTKPYRRCAPHPVDVAYRMAYVGTVAVFDRDRELLVSRRYAATPEEGPDELVARVMADLVAARRQRPDLVLMVVQDGAAELWGLIWEAMKSHGIRDYRSVIDRYHYNEHLAAALQIVVRDPIERARLYAQWQRDLDRHDNAAERLGAALDRYDVPKSSFVEFHRHRDYLAGYGRRTQYARHLRDGLPIGSGVTEGACKSLITARAKRSGQRWYQDGLSACLALRSIHLSGRLEPFWRHFQRRYTASVTAA